MPLPRVSWSVWRRRLRRGITFILSSIETWWKEAPWPWKKSPEEKLLLQLAEEIHVEPISNPPARHPGWLSFFYWLSIFSLISGIFFLLLPFLTFSPSQGGRLILGIITRDDIISTHPWYPARTSWEDFLTSLLYAPLNELGKLERYDEKSLLWTANPNARWSTSHPIEADDVIFSFLALQNPETRSPWGRVLKDWNVEKISDTSVRFIAPSSIDEPHRIVENIRPLPRNPWESLTFEQRLKTDLLLKPISSGIWKFGSLVRNLEGNIENYTLRANSTSQRWLEEVTTVGFSNYQTALFSLAEGNIEAILGTTTGFQNADPKDGKLILSSTNYDDVILLNRTNPLFSNVKNRSAFLTGIWNEAQKNIVLENPFSKDRWMTAWRETLSNIPSSIPWALSSTPVRATTLSIIIPEEIYLEGFWDAIIEQSNLALRTRYGASRAPQLVLEVVPESDFHARTIAGSFDIAVERVRHREVSTRGRWWQSSPWLSRDPLRARALEALLIGNEKAAVEGLLATWPAVVVNIGADAVMVNNNIYVHPGISWGRDEVLTVLYKKTRPNFDFSAIDVSSFNLNRFFSSRRQ